VQADFNISGTATLNGTTWNYVKVRYSEADGNTRARAKKSGSYVYEKIPSFSIVVDSVAPTDYDLNLGRVRGDGATWIEFQPEARTKMLGDKYDYIVTSSDDFKHMITRDSAGDYRIKTSLETVYIEPGVTISWDAMLQAGDTTGTLRATGSLSLFEWGDLSKIEFSGATGFSFRNDVIKKIKGMAIEQSSGTISGFIGFDNYKIEAVYEGCSVKNIVGDAGSVAFYEHASAADRRKNKYIRCLVDDVSDSLSVHAFYFCNNVQNCEVINLASVNVVYAFHTCEWITCSRVETLRVTAGAGLGLFAFESCKHITDFRLTDFDMQGTGSMTLFNSCEHINGGYINGALVQIDADIIIFNACNYIQGVNAEEVRAWTGYDLTALNSCNNVSNCRFHDLSANQILYGASGCNFLDSIDFDFLRDAGTVYGFYNCWNISNSKTLNLSSTGDIAGFFQCNIITGSYVKTVQRSSGGIVSGFSECNRVTGCFVDGITGNQQSYGFYDCEVLSGCEAINLIDLSVQACGFFNCLYLSACKATIITAPTNTWGFNGCEYGSSLWTDKATNINNDWIDTVDANITNKVSTPSVWT
jgi:hypothetical protein